MSWGTVLLQHPDVVLPEIRLLLPQNLSHRLFVNTHHVCNRSHTHTSIFANIFTDFLNVLVGFLKSKGGLDVDHLQLPPDPH